MKTESHSINDVLAKNATSFFIPPFQRAYAWGKTEIERYFSDIIRIINSELDTAQHDKLEHFFGTVVIKEEKEGFANKSIVVDGQQRLTTTLLFLIALRDLETDEVNKNYITQNYLTNNASTNEDKIKLKQVTKDWEAYKSLVNNKATQEGIINNAYQIFCKLISDLKSKNKKILFKHFIVAIQRINVAVIFLDERPHKGEDPQIIFETLNSLGKPLTLSDLVRNYVLLNMDSNNQSVIYENIWHPKIENILSDKTSEFFRDYLQYKTQSSIKVVSDNNTKEVYQLFKNFVSDNFASNNDFVTNIVCYVDWYKWIITVDVNDSISKDNKKNNDIKELLRNIFHDIKAEAFKPFVLGLLEYHANVVNGVKINDELLIEILKSIRTYLIRRRVLALTQGENKNIVLLIKDIEKLAKEEVTMVALLSTMFYKLRMPNDSELKNALSKMKFYEERKKYSKFILGKIEEKNAKVPVDFRNPKITIEHIMPQKINESWKNELGNNFDTIHKSYLHNIGNLILTEFNSEIGNKPFSDKKIKLATSNLNFRLYILNKEVWNENSIEEHRDKMINWFLETFSLPLKNQIADNWNSRMVDSVSFSPLDIEASYLGEGNKPVELRIFDSIIKVSSWQAVFLKFLKYLKDKNDYTFDFILNNQELLFRKDRTILKWSVLKLDIESNNDLTSRYKNFDGKCWDKINNLSDEELFIHINISSQTCMSRISNIMNQFSMDESDVEIVLK